MPKDEKITHGSRPRRARGKRSARRVTLVRRREAATNELGE